jgi:hypothetical protein
MAERSIEDRERYVSYTDMPEASVWDEFQNSAAAPAAATSEPVIGLLNRIISDYEATGPEPPCSS